MQTKVIIGTQGNIATYQGGYVAGETIVFVHGDSARASQWDGVMKIIGRHHKVVAFDGAGHGASEPAREGDYRFSARADDLGKILQAYNIKSMVLVAHSGSVGTVLKFASDNQDKVRAIFLLDPATDPRAMPKDISTGFLGALQSPDALDAIKGYYASIAGDNPQIIAQVVGDAAQADPAARYGVAEALVNWNPQVALDKWDGPITALITSANDNPAALYHLKADMGHVLVSTKGHWPQLDARDEVAAAITATINQLNK
ncbi:MAG: alpha/beta hydrolase [Cohaesibacteraceae bacterium]|nr:alpha/beta hydrolase [Cohaesibacteraceae bacterium]